MKRLAWKWTLFGRTRWSGYCLTCGWEGQPRRSELTAFEEGDRHWCQADVPSYDKGYRRIP